MRVKNVNKVLILVIVTLLFVGIVGATELNKTNMKKDAKIVKQSQKTVSVPIKLNSTTKKSKSQKDIIKKINNKTSENKAIKKSAMDYSADVSSYSELCDKINEAKESDYDSYSINLKNRSYHLLNSISWGDSLGTKTLIINGNGATIKGDKCSRLLDVYPGYTLKLKNINFYDFKVSDSDWDNNEAGVISNKGNLSLTNCIFKNNGNDVYSEKSDKQKGYKKIGIIVNSGKLRISKSLFANNTVEYRYGGGTINNLDYGTSIIIQSIFENNKGSCGTLNNYGTLIIDETQFTKNNGRRGGAIFNRNNNMTITNSILNNNEADFYGGAIYNKNNNYNNNININSCVLNNNEAKVGGALHNFKGKYTITNCTINNNIADDGAVYNSGRISFIECKINNNTAKYGGAIYNNKIIRITKSSFKNNKAKESGGALYNYNYGIIKITNSTLNNNKANDYYGGAIFSCYRGTIKISNSKVNKNIAKYGGAIRSEGNVTIIKSTLNNNKAITGGAIQLYSTNDWDNTSKFVYGNLTIINSTLNNNRAKDDGGAINSDSHNNIIKNNKFSKNSATWGAALYIRYTVGYKKIINNIFIQNKANGDNVIENQGNNTIIKNNKNEKTSIYKGTIDVSGNNITICNNVFQDYMGTKMRIKLNKAKTYVNSYLKASIKLKDDVNNILKNQKIKIKFGKKTFTVKTNSKGIATKTYKTTKTGTLKISAYYAGSKAYKKSTKSTKIKVLPKIKTK
ncbi:MAG: hypothetical protein IJJ47_09090 [Methanosphaera sp.]|nr:hypothetical protein [Methanosphaera sp.]